MLRIYLDQNKWVDLARAAHQHPMGAPFQDVLALAREAVAKGLASFPLDMARYIETQKRGNLRSRHELATTMYELSRLHGVAPPKVVLPCEIDAALKRRLGVPESPRNFQIFGVGIEHTSGGGVSLGKLLTLPDALSAVPGLRTTISGAVLKELEWSSLFGLDPRGEVPAEYVEAMESMTQDLRYAEYETGLAKRLVDTGFSKGENLDRAMWATDMVDIKEPLAEALTRAGVSFQWLMDNWTPNDFADFMEDIPTRHVTKVLRRDKHAQGQQRWEPNDLNDVISLPIAAVYCDVVVTEKQWVNRMTRAAVDRRYNTKIMHDLRNLLPVLVQLTP